MSREAQAALNNACWCEAVCRAHGIPGVFNDSIWLNRAVTPPFYPNAVTLTGPTDTAEQIKHIKDLLQAGIPGEWAVKDSFAALDLSPLGFRVLFEATWLWRSASASRLDLGGEGIQWVVVRDRTQLALWEAAWSGKTLSLPDSQRTFLPQLINDLEILFIAGYQKQQIIAGGIANRTEGVVGISNVFCPARLETASWAGVLAAAIDHFPGLPLVGYEHGDSLAIAQSLGFERLQPLRIWARVLTGA